MNSIIGQVLVVSQTRTHTHAHTLQVTVWGKVVLRFSDKVNFMHRVQ